MSKALIGAAVVIGAAVFAKRHAMSGGGFDFETWIGRMPDNAPPKWMFRNISAIRENTDRIQELLESDQNADTDEGPVPLKPRAARSGGLRRITPGRCAGVVDPLGRVHSRVLCGTRASRAWCSAPCPAS